ncbi:MAG TPA: 2-phospho-L-lactate transferase [Pseudomonadales bacterium]|nr:2-phospho-L-lactate transferase [Pseudomonadales bacterium]
MSRAHRIVALTGGVGGAKLGLGLAQLLDADALRFVVNTGDDFDHLGLRICPDLDTLLYTLSDEANPETGWGRRGESWQFMDALRQLGGESWFNLGDRDLATHVTRTRLLAEGHTLTAATAELGARLGVRHAMLPMSDDPVATVVQTPDGDLAFQHYFVRDRCEPAVTGFRFDGIEAARPSDAVVAALSDPELTGIVLCPSNPFVSIDPILSVPGLRALLTAATCPIVAVSPIVGGMAIKGPTAKMMDELGVPRTQTAVAQHYADFLDGLLLDETDADARHAVAALGPATDVAQSVMLTFDDRVALAERVLAFLESLATG